jgi:hypothetical protein
VTLLQPYATPGSFSAKQLRLAQGALFARGSTAIKGRSGVIGTSGLAVTQTGTPSMGVLVASGQLALQGSVAADQGLYLATADATTTVNLSAAPVGNPRRDLIYAQITDATDGTGAGYTLVIDKVTGTPAASPTLPAVPTDGFGLADVAVGVGVSSIVNANITDLRSYTAALGGIIPCTSATRPSHAAGLTIYEIDTGLVQISNGTSWKQIKPDGPRGLMASPVGSTTTTSSTTTTEIKDSQVGDYVFTAVSGRQYEVHYSGRAQSDAGATTMNVYIRDGGGSSPTNASTLLAADSIYLGGAGGAGGTSVTLCQVVSGLSAGTHTLAAFFQRTAGGGNCTMVAVSTVQRQLYAKDIGT